MSAIARFERSASFPPRNIVTFPDLKQRAAASAVTLGRDSKMITITPIGHVILLNLRPLGR